MSISGDFTKHCPNCGRRDNVYAAGAVFIEAGEWDGKRYAAEGDYPRWWCRYCNYAFGEMPYPNEDKA